MAALCVAWAVVLLVPGQGPAADAPRVVVTTEDLPAGTDLRAEQLTTTVMGSAPDSSVPVEDLIGERLAIGLPRGTPVVPTMLVGPGVAHGAPPGTVVTAVHLSDPTLLQLIHVGDRVDLYAPTTPTGTAPAQAQLITAGALVLSVLGSPQDSAGLLNTAVADGTGALVVAVRDEDASLLTGASGVSSFRAVVVPGG